MKNVIILRGVSGSGKSSFANLIAEPKVVCTADDYFTNDKGEYNFDANLLSYAHGDCMRRFTKALDDPNVTNIVVANTNCNPNDYNFYIDEAKRVNVRVTSVILEKRHDNSNIHSVPENVLENQHNRLIKNLKLK